jgi:hypothetical protein
MSLGEGGKRGRGTVHQEGSWEKTDANDKLSQPISIVPHKSQKSTRK